MKIYLTQIIFEILYQLRGLESGAISRVLHQVQFTISTHNFFSLFIFLTFTVYFFKIFLNFFESMVEIDSYKKVTINLNHSKELAIPQVLYMISILVEVALCVLHRYVIIIRALAMEDVKKYLLNIFKHYFIYFTISFYNSPNIQFLFLHTAY